MTDEEMQAQLDLADARLDVANGKVITRERYRDIIESLRAGRASRAAALAENAKERSKAKRRNSPALDPADFFGLQQ